MEHICGGKYHHSIFYEDNFKTNATHLLWMPLGVLLQVGLIAVVIELHYSCCILQLILEWSVEKT